MKATPQAILKRFFHWLSQDQFNRWERNNADIVPIYCAMQEYAKQEAVEFVRWLEYNYETYLPLEELYKIWKEEMK